MFNGLVNVFFCVIVSTIDIELNWKKNEGAETAGSGNVNIFYVNIYIELVLCRHEVFPKNASSARICNFQTLWSFGSRPKEANLAL
jgi:hypothetical protein